MAQVEQVHALVDQLAAAGDRRVGAPLAVVAGSAAVAVAGAHVHGLAVQARARLGDRAGDAGVEAVVEADLDEAPAPCPRRRRSASTSAAPTPGGLLDQHVGAGLERARRPRRRAGRGWTATITTSGARPAARRATGRTAPRAAAASAVAARASTSKTPTSSSCAERRGALAADQPAADDADAQPLPRVTYSAPKHPWKSKSKRSSRRRRAAIAWRVSSGASGVDEQEAAAAGADQLAADGAAAARQRVELVDPLCWPCPASVRACSPSARASARRRPSRSPRLEQRPARRGRSPSCGRGWRRISASPRSRALVLVGEDRRWPRGISPV